MVGENRELVTLRTIDKIEPIPDADNLELATVDGWQVVVKKNEFQIGRACFYHEIDSLLPVDNPSYAFLALRGLKEVDGKKYHRLRTIKLRGQISQGLLIPYSELYKSVNEYVNREWDKPGRNSVPITYTEALGVLKYDDVVTVNVDNGDTAGSFPTKYGNKTDAERVQNLSKYWEAIKAEKWIATEKIDGCSLSVFRDEEGNLRVCSRNWEVKDGDNVYWNAVRNHPFISYILQPGEGLQAEIFGEGIQKNRLGVKGQRIAIFNFLINGIPQDYCVWADREIPYAVPVYRLELPDTLEEAIAQADGIKSLISPDRLAEGIVWTHADAKILPFLGRHCFKVISNKFLLRFE